MNRIIALAAAGALAATAAPALADLAPGAKAPDFKADAYLAGKPFTFDMAAARKKGPVVLYFFPSAHTKGCNLEAHLFSEAADEFKAQGATLIGVTAGNTERLAEFSKDTEKCAGKFPVAADEGAKIAKSFDATMTMKPDLSSRTSYLIGKDGRVAAEFDAMNPNQHIKQMLDALSAIKAKPGAKG